jgi:hypothetical protein
MGVGGLSCQAASPDDGRYDYRYSVLPLVFAGLVRNGLLAEEELAGLAEDKREFILGVARMEMPSR